MDAGDGNLPHGFTGHYTFTNGACQDWSCKEYIGGQDCADPSHWNDRLLENVTSSFTISTCFSQCTTDGTCAAISGCTDPAAINHFDAATEDDGSCIYMNESNLPLVQITTDTPILDDPRIVANMKVTNLPSGFNTLGDSPTNTMAKSPSKFGARPHSSSPSNRMPWKPRIPPGPTTTFR